MEGNGTGRRARADVRVCVLARLCALALLAAPLWPQISPGPLSNAHKDLEGSLNCSKCHTFGAAKRSKCTGCHVEIQHRLSAGRGYHAQVVKRKAGDSDCVRCHTDHYGREFSIVKQNEFIPERFNHKEAGYLLEGAHAKLTCQKCHNAKLIAPAERAVIKVRDGNRTYLGLGTRCISCHADFHKGQLGADCARCHSQTTWKETSKEFDHGQTKYPLTGMHERVQCAKCHPKDEAGAVKYKVPFAQCSDCHKDPHRGAFESSAGCDSCHTVAGWKQILTTSSRFDHDRTKFPLKGKHAPLRCFECHKNSNFKQPVAHALCMDCHKDKHGGQFATRPDKGECGPCHNEVAYKPSLYTVRDHERSRYPLEGRHATVECGKCHLPAGESTKYKLAFNACTSCHQDVHLRQFAGPPHENRCEDCHTVREFRPSTYSIGRHRKESRFALTGAHSATSCNGCHKPETGQPASAALYHFQSLDCTGCHNDPHRGQLAAVMAKTEVLTCESCHNTRSWKGTGPFDHSRTSFELSGAHRVVVCTECHRPQISVVSVRDIVFKGAPKECEKCHQDVHAKQFEVRGSTACGGCHSSVVWKPATFDHEETAFPLTGLHRAVPCQDCHKTYTEAGTRRVLLYKPSPTRCVSCHSDLRPDVQTEDSDGRL